MGLPDGQHHVRAALDDLDPLSAPSVYYNPHQGPRRDPRTRTYSTVIESGRPYLSDRSNPPTRRTSHDETTQFSKQFHIRNVDKTIQELLEREDLDGDGQITIDDVGPKILRLGTVASNGYKTVDIRTNYILSNLLQELTLAKAHGCAEIILDLARINENPVSRLSRFIRTSFWENLTRRIDASNIEKVALDSKDWTSDPRPRIYVPRGAPEQYEYYSKLAVRRPEIRLDVQWLPSEKITGEYVRDLNDAPGLLAVAMEEITDPATGVKDLRGIPFVVPGGRFNELYGWDSYMISIGLLVNDQVGLAKDMVTHFCFCIQHYGKIFNANRSYFLGRSQPPFLTDMAMRVYERIKTEPGALDFLKIATQAAIKEYHGVWVSEPRLDPITGLSRYRPVGVGVPPETERSHFTHILMPYAKKHGVTVETFVQMYNSQSVHEPELDEYFLHDRAVRESGHDTSYRLENVAANLATVDLNSLLYKYEIDISRIISQSFGNQLVMPAEFCAEGKEPGYVETSSAWDRRAKKRRTAVDTYLWNGTKGMYFDYDTVQREQKTYESATTFWAMWAGLASVPQATAMVQKALPRFEVLGGLVSGTEESRGKIGLDRPNRQWDYPYGWAPQQILAWSGLLRYQYKEEAQRLAYRWLYMVTKAFFDFNGIVVEKYNVLEPIEPHKVDAEYGNQGSDFKGVATEGFGWVNASYVYGLTFVNNHMKRALGTLTPWETFQRQTENSVGRG